MMKAAKETSDQVIYSYNTNVSTGLNSNQINLLRKAHGLNKLEEEEKVCFSLEFVCRYLICEYITI